MFPRMLTRVRHDGARRRASDVPERQTGVAGVMAGWRIVIFTLGCLATLALAPAALANTSAPPASVTQQMSGVLCSATAYFNLTASTGTMGYGGGVSCAGGVGQKTIDVVPQVFNVVNGKPLWFSISLVGLYQGPTPINPLRLSGITTYVPSHTYRLLVYGAVTLPDGRRSSVTACSGCTGVTPKLSIFPSYTYLAQPPTAARLPGIPCTVSQNGLLFTLVNQSYVLNYGGFAVCGGARPVSTGTLSLCAQVGNLINGKAVWFTITGSCLSRGPTATNNLFLSTARSAYIGHAYRIMVSTTIRYPTSNGTLTRSKTVYSAASGP